MLDGTYRTAAALADPDAGGDAHLRIGRCEQRLSAHDVGSPFGKHDGRRVEVGVGFGIDWPYYPGFGYWGRGTWAGLTDWVDYGWSDPVYYNYGENVYYDDGSVYYGDQVACTEEEYAQQAEAIATSVPETPPAAEDWMPLGVFALTSDGQPTGVPPTMFLQLAVSKQGVINGTFQNTTTGSVQAIEGMVDKQTQRAAWTAAGKSRPLMESGIGNLTEDSTPVLVHFADDTTQQWLLVRLEEPKGVPATPPSQ